MTRETIEAYLNRGGKIIKINYKTFEQVTMPTPGGMREIIENQRFMTHKAREAGLASGVARRAKAALRRGQC